MRDSSLLAVAQNDADNIFILIGAQPLMASIPDHQPFSQSVQTVYKNRKFFLPLISFFGELSPTRLLRSFALPML